MPATYDPRFVDNLSQLQLVERQQAQSQLVGAAFPWFTPAPAEGWLGDLHSAFQVASAFSREDLDQQYVDLVSPADPTLVGSQAAALAVRVQADVLAQLERAYRARHATPIKCAAHASARRYGHGQPGGVFTALLEHVGHLVNEEV